MSIRVALNHVTHYRYDRLVALSPQVVRLRPAPHCRTPILSYSMRVEPAEHFINWQQDAFANYQARLVFPEKTREFKVTVDLVAEMAVYNPFDFFLEDSAEKFPFAYDEALATELAPYRVVDAEGPAFDAYVAAIPLEPRATMDFLVSLGPQIVRLRPAPHCRTPILSYSLKVEPAEHFINWQQDPFANYLARLVFPEKTREFKVTIDLVAEMAVYNPFDFFLEESAEKFPFKYDDALAVELAPYMIPDAPTPMLTKFVESIPREPLATMDFMVALNQRLQSDIRYLIRMEPGVQTPEQTLTLASGSCRDSGWLMVQVLRQLGLAARFVSGYLIQLAPDQKALDGPSGTEIDFTDLHAWCEVYLPGAGWIGFDPTSGLLAGEGHIPLACTPQPSSAAPISGGVDESEVEFSHHMAVSRIWESPRVTLPYSEEQWKAVLALGDRVDAQLVAGDVRLTMGGEPTFVSIDDFEAAEWNIDAVGPTKRAFGDRKSVV